MSTNNTIRLRTQPDGSDRYINFKLDQDFDFIEILSLKLSQKDLYPTFCANYGVVVGRVFSNRGLGIPNAKVSIFIPVDSFDSQNDKIFGMYPYKTITDINSEGIRYNLLSSRNNTNDDCFTPVGTFPEKRQFLDNDDLLDVYCKYYKFTTTTNHAGDYMLFGIPTGSHILHAEADLSDIGILSQSPSDLIEKGSSIANFESTSKFKTDKNLNNLNQIIVRSPISVNVYPFWGDEERCNASITRMDIDLNINITPNAIFMGSIFGDNESEAVNYRCKPSNGLGKLDRQHALPGRIEMIRKTVSGSIERFDIQGGQLIDQDGTWAYQVPMNLDYMVTDEFGSLVPTFDTDRGIPTKAKVRFRITMDGDGGSTSNDTFKRGSFLIPHNPVAFNPQSGGDGPFIDFSFGSDTYDSSFAEFYWNTIYSIKSFIPRYEHAKEFRKRSSQVRSFIGIKDVDSGGGRVTPFPYNRLNIASDGMFNFLCGLYMFLSVIIVMINASIITPINAIIEALNSIFDIAYIECITLSCNIEGEDPRDFAPGCGFNTPGCQVLESGNTICMNQPGMDNDFDQTLPPGDAGFTQCVALSLIQSMNLIEFDFYNDWINGTLYAPLFAIRERLADKEGNPSTVETYFCETACDGLGFGFGNLPEALGNKCYDDIYIKDTCMNNTVPALCGEPSVNNPCGTVRLLPPPLHTMIGGSDGSSEELLPFQAPFNRRGITNTGPVGQIHNIESGIISYKDGHYYYTPNTFRGDFKLFAVDIITLGSSVNCHWKGTPYVSNLFVETTYKKPPFLSITDITPDPMSTDTTPTPIISGMDSLSNSVSDSLFFSVNCFFFTSEGTQCGNLKRQCELGVGYDSLRYDSSLSQPWIGTSMDSLITPEEIDVRITRKLFAWMNSDILNTQYQFNPLGVDVDFDSTPTCGAVLGSNDYNTFIYDTVYDNNGVPSDFGTVCNPFPRTNNSFYFYFGLNRNKTALKKLIDKYISPCPIIEVNDFIVIANIESNTDMNSPNGSLTITVQGGSEPITYILTLPDGSQIIITDGTSTQIFDQLSGGTYTLTVTDSANGSSTTVYNIPNPTPLTCSYNSIGVSSGTIDDGIINVFINGGLAPYTITMSPTGSINGSVITNSTSYTIDSLSDDDYDIIVTDSLGATCSSTVTVPGVPELYFTVNALPPLTGSTTDVGTYIHVPLSDYTKCNNTPTGRISVKAFGGEAPYDMYLYDSTNTLIAGPILGVYGVYTFDELNDGVYFVEVKDFNGTVATGVGTGTPNIQNGSRLTLIGNQYRYIIYNPNVLQVGTQLLGNGSVKLIGFNGNNVWPWPDVNYGYETVAFFIYDTNGNLIDSVTNHPINLPNAPEHVFTNLVSGSYYAQMNIGFCSSQQTLFTIN